MTEVAGTHESVCRIWTETLHTLGYHFFHRRDDDFGFFRADDTIVACMRIQREDSDARTTDAEILLQRAMEDFHLFHNQFLGNGSGNVLHRDVSCHQCHSEIVFQQNHQCLVVIAYTFLDVFGMSRKVEAVRLDGVLVDRCCHQHIDIAFAIVLQRSFQRIQSCLSGFGSRLGQFHLQFVFRTAQDIQLSVLRIVSIVDDGETGLNIHRFPMIGCHLRRTIHNRCTQIQHSRV